jgi:transcriptional regulator with XRE-family HTH domain
MPVSLGQKIAKARKVKGLSQTALAKLVGVSQSAVSAYENDTNEPAYSVMLKIADVLGIPEGDLRDRPSKAD